MKCRPRYGLRGGMRTVVPWTVIPVLALLSLAALAGNPPGGDHSDAHRDCKGCHANHSAAGGGLLAAPDADELCASCHQKTAELAVRNPDPSAPVQIPDWKGIGSSHLGTTLGLKNAKPFVRRAEQGGRRVVMRQGCEGCHDAHARGPSKLREVSFDNQGRLEAVGTAPARSAQVCFGCHAGSEAVRSRQVRDAQPDLGSKFSPGAASSHFMGRRASDRPDLPSLNGTPFTGRLDCISCHSSPPGEEGSGPHVSPYPHLLAAPYGTETDGEYPDRAAELCYACHGRASIETNQSFPYHRQHIQGFLDRAGGIQERPQPRALERGSAPSAAPKRPGDMKSGHGRQPLAGFGQQTPCATCHDPHGSVQNPALVRFDATVVRPASVGGPDFRRTGAGHGTCTLTCHGEEHIDARY